MINRIFVSICLNVLFHAHPGITVAHPVASPSIDACVVSIPTCTAPAPNTVCGPEIRSSPHCPPTHECPPCASAGSRAHGVPSSPPQQQVEFGPGAADDQVFDIVHTHRPLAHPPLSPEPSAIEAAFSPRRTRNLLIGFSTQLLVNSNGAAPLPGLLFGGNLGPHWALELQIHSLGIYNQATVGAKGFFSDRWISPYCYLRGGVMHLQVMKSELMGALFSTGMGVEMVGDGGFTGFLEAGFTKGTADDDMNFGSISAGIGYRF